MANKHFGNLADVFKHLALCEALGAARPAEYWESHCGAALYTEDATPAAERAHGIHHFAHIASKIDALRLSYYAKARALAAPPSGAGSTTIPGSPFLARVVVGESPRRMLLCDLDNDALQNVQQVLSAQSAAGRGLSADKLECIPDDGISVLRGAGVLLPEQWGNSTFAFLDPDDIHAATAAGISPLELACELANRSVVALVFYCFPDDPGRRAQHQAIHAALEKARLLGHGTCRWEGSLHMPPREMPPTQWGFGLLGLNIAPPVGDAIDQKLRALQQAYERMPAALGEGILGTWSLTRTTL